MLKEAQMCIKMEPELHQDFLAASKRAHRPAAQIVRDLMRAYLERSTQQPNDETLAAIAAIERGEVVTYASAEDFYEEAGI